MNVKCSSDHGTPTIVQVHEAELNVDIRNLTSASIEEYVMGKRRLELTEIQKDQLPRITREGEIEETCQINT